MGSGTGLVDLAIARPMFAIQCLKGQ